MKEILFIAKSRKRNVWTEGKDLIQGLPYSNIDGIEVKSETLSQYTTKDADNGDKIFSGGLLDIEFGEYPTKKHKGVEVYWSDTHLQWCVRGGNIKSDVFEQSLVGYHKPKYTITGNIHDKTK